MGSNLSLPEFGSTEALRMDLLHVTNTVFSSDCWDRV